jgi:hypothetical protein
MTISLTHAFTSGISDDLSVPAEVRPSNWNAQHVFSLAGGVLFGRGSTGAGAPEEIAIVNDANVTATLTANTLTLGWAGALAVPRGGTGAASLTANGVLFGSGTGAVQATAVGPANSVLAANAGAPFFTAGPIIDHIVVPNAVYGGSAANSQLTLRSTTITGSGDRISMQTGAAAERMSIDSGGNIVCGTGALATNATNGFFFMPGMPGSPSSTPTIYSSRLPMVYDSTHDYLWAYTATGWKSAAFSAGTPSIGGYGTYGISVKNYNAVGDGNADDSQAIKNAIAALGALGGQIFFPPGIYKISSTINVPNNVSLYGAGAGIAYAGAYPLTPTTTFTWAGTGQGPMFACASQYSGTMEGFTLDPNHAHVDGIWIYEGSFAQFRRVDTFRFAGAGTNCWKAIQQNYPTGSCVWEGCGSWDHWDQVVGFYGNGITGCHFNKCRIMGGNNGGTGLRCDNGSDTNTFTACDITTGGNSGIVISLQNCGFNFNFRDGAISPLNATDHTTLINADNNNGFMHFWHVYLGWDFTNITPVYDPNNTGYIWFHSCLGPPGGGQGTAANNCADFWRVNVVQGGSTVLPIYAGLLLLTDEWLKVCALFLISGGNNVHMLQGDNGPGVAWGITTSPAGGQLTLGWNGSNYSIYNNTGSSRAVRVSLMQTSPGQLGIINGAP